MTRGQTSSPADVMVAALDRRLFSAATILLDRQEQAEPDPERPGRFAASVLPDLVGACGPRPGPAHWLLLTAVWGAFPPAGEVQTLARQIELEPVDVTIIEILERVRQDPNRGRLDLPIRVVTDAVVVDVDFCARDDKHTGIQRVVREILPRWREAHEILAVAAIDEHTAYRTLAPRESARVFHHGLQAPSAEKLHSRESELVVPWDTVVVLPEVPGQHSIETLAAMAQYSGNEVALVGYDMIPLISTDLRPEPEAGVFARYLWLVKHAHRVAGISTSATAEFHGFARMLPAQGLAGPVVTEIELPEEAGGQVTRPGLAEPARPVIMATGSREPHKNLLTVLHAAERLWSEGHDFQLVTIGSHGWDERALTSTGDRIVAAGHPLVRLGWVSDEEMWQRLQDATFTVFVSLHEGFGLPVAESLACGTPVVTSDFGSQREIADKGGCLVVDPRDDRAVTDAMRRMLNDPGLRARLREEIAHRPTRRWDDYAREAWAFLVEGVEP